MRDGQGCAEAPRIRLQEAKTASKTDTFYFYLYFSSYPTNSYPKTTYSRLASYRKQHSHICHWIYRYYRDTFSSLLYNLIQNFYKISILQLISPLLPRASGCGWGDCLSIESLYNGGRGGQREGREARSSEKEGRWTPIP